uniref:L antigen family member 3 n=1 Tax=Prolemur simus TaxID=1328070 RepID=A0A8C8YQE5_PROSS
WSPWRPGRQGGPGGPSGPGSQVSPGGPDSQSGSSSPGQGGPGTLEVQGGPAGPGCPRGRETMGAAAASALHAEMALRSVASDAQRHQQLAVQKEFRVNGSALAVRWASEDTGLLRISINSFLDHLSLVMRSIHRIWPPFPLSLGWEKKAET